MALHITALDDTPDTRFEPLAQDRLTVLPDLEAGPRDAAIEDLLRLATAARELRATLESCERMYEASLDRLIAGRDPGEAIHGVDVSGARLSITEALTEFERARHHARGTFINAQHDEGMNMKEIGRVWGISRQLAHRFFKESQRETSRLV